MHEINKPFRFTWDFGVAWALLFLAALFLVPRWSEQPPHEHYLLVIITSFFATFVLYGPVLLLRQVIRSGSRGWFVARVFATIVLVAAALLGTMYAMGIYGAIAGHIFGLLFTAAAITYLHYRLQRES